MGQERQHDKHFHLDEARALLPEVKETVLRITALVQKLDELGFNVYQGQYKPGLSPNGSTPRPSQFERLVELAQGLDANGVVVKDLAAGLVDFPHIRDNGEEVYLCWKLGEASIDYWHTLTGGFAGRRPLSEL